MRKTVKGEVETLGIMVKRAQYGLGMMNTWVKLHTAKSRRGKRLERHTVATLREQSAL